MNPPAILFGALAFAWVIFLLWRRLQRAPTIEEIVAQRGPLARIQVFPELRLPDAPTKEPGTGRNWADAIVKILVFIWAVSLIKCDDR